MECHQILTDGGAGDLICELVAVDYNIKHHPEVHFQVWVPDYLLTIAKHLVPRGTTVRPFSKAKAKFRGDLPGMTTEWCTDHTPMRTHPVDYGFHMLSDRHIYRLEDKNYLQIRPDEIDLKEFKLPKEYVCMAATFAEPVKTMPPETFQTIVEYFINKKIPIVFLGKERSPAGFLDFMVKGEITKADLSQGLNLINKTDLLESAGIIAGARLFIGMDGGLIHVAGCTQTPIVAGYTLVDPIHVAPIRGGMRYHKFLPIEPNEKIPNRYYQTYHSGFKAGDFRQFPGWEDVVASMTPEKFIKGIGDLL